MKKQIIILGLVLLLVVPMVFAFDTKITVKTEPSRILHIRVYTPSMEKLQEFLGEEANNKGEITITHTSPYIKFYLTTFSKEDGEGDLNDFPNVSAGKDIYIDLTKEPHTLKYAEDKVEIKNETANNSGIDVQVAINNNTTNNTIIENETTLASVNQEKTETSKLTGFAINNGKKVLTSLVTYYILGGLLILIAGFIFIKKKAGKEKPFTVTKYSDIQKNRIDAVEEDNSIADAERKLEEAKREIEDIKNKKAKVAEAKKRIEDAKRELDELGEY